MQEAQVYEIRGTHASSKDWFLPRALRQAAAQGIAGAPQEYAPALQPTLQLYRELYKRGFSVTFITGRQAPCAMFLA